MIDIERMMDMQEKCLIIGGDLRQYYMKCQLEEKGCEVRCIDVPNPNGRYGGEEQLEAYIKWASVIMLPIPVWNKEKYISGTDSIDLTQVMQYLQSGQVVFGGNIPESMKEQCEKNDVVCYDYLKLPGLAEKNAVATAEGTIAQAVVTGAVNLEGSCCVVTGYGACAGVLAGKLGCLGARVTVIARNENQRKKAVECGFYAVDFNQEETKQVIRRSDYIFNTVPALVITEELIACAHKDTVIIDIASYPGGVDFEACERYGICAKLCLGLPGKYSPKTSAAILLENVERVL